MAKSSITALELYTTETRSGLLGRRTVREEALRMDTPGGSVYLSQSAVEGGDSWTRIKRRLGNLAKEKGISYTDSTQ